MRKERLYLQDILKACERAAEYCGSRNQIELFADQLRVDAIIRNLEIIGEAVKNVPSEFLDLQPAIPWRQIARFRDRVAHAYFWIDEDIIWDILQSKLPELRVAVAEILNLIPEEPASQSE